MNWMDKLERKWGTTCGRQSEQIFCTCAGDWIRGTADGTRTHELYEF